MIFKVSVKCFMKIHEKNQSIYEVLTDCGGTKVIRVHSCQEEVLLKVLIKTRSIGYAA